MRIWKESKSPGKTDVPKLYAYNECEHSVNKGGNGKEGGHKGAESLLYFNKQIDKVIYPLLPSLSP